MNFHSQNVNFSWLEVQFHQRIQIKTSEKPNQYELLEVCKGTQFRNSEIKPSCHQVHKIQNNKRFYFSINLWKYYSNNRLKSKKLTFKDEKLQSDFAWSGELKIDYRFLHKGGMNWICYMVRERAYGRGACAPIMRRHVFFHIICHQIGFFLFFCSHSHMTWVSKPAEMPNRPIQIVMGNSVRFS